MSILKVNTIQDKGGNAIISSDGSGTLTLPSDLKNTPAFCVTLSSNQSVSDATDTKIQFTNVIKDTASAYDNSTNYRWTCPSGGAGTYILYGQCVLNGDGAATFVEGRFEFRINGSNYQRNAWNDYNSYGRNKTLVTSIMADISVGDYIEGYTNFNYGGSSGELASGTKHTLMQGFRLIGA